MIAIVPNDLDEYVDKQWGSMARILVTWELGGGMGHLLPMRSLTKVLLARGHRVHFACRELAKAKSVFQDIDLTLEQAPVYRSKRPSPYRLARTFAELLLSEGLEDLHDHHQRCIAWRNIYGRRQPDYLLCDHSPTAMLAARGIAIPTGTIGTGFCCPANQTPLPNWRISPQGYTHDTASTEQVAVDHLNQVLANLKAPAFSTVSQLYASIDNIFLQTYPELDHFPEREGGNYYGIPPLEQGVKAQWPSGVGKRIFAYLKPSRFTINVIKHLAIMRMPTLVYAPGMTEDLIAYCLQNFPAIHFETNPIDLQVVAKECGIAVHHGTHGTAAAFLLAGKPSLVFPIQLEQTLTGIRLQNMGVARMANPFDDARLIDGLHNVLVSDELAANAEAFASRYASWNAANNLDKIVDEIEKQLHR